MVQEVDNPRQRQSEIEEHDTWPTDLVFSFLSLKKRRDEDASNGIVPWKLGTPFLIRRRRVAMVDSSDGEPLPIALANPSVPMYRLFKLKLRSPGRTQHKECHRVMVTVEVESVSTCTYCGSLWKPFPPLTRRVAMRVGLGLVIAQSWPHRADVQSFNKYCRK